MKHEDILEICCSFIHLQRACLCVHRCVRLQYLTAALGMEPYSRELRPLYRPLTPWPFTVCFTQSTEKRRIYCTRIKKSSLIWYTQQLLCYEHLAATVKLLKEKSSEFLCHSLKQISYRVSTDKHYLCQSSQALVEIDNKLTYYTNTHGPVCLHSNT